MRILLLLLFWAGTQVQGNAQEEQGFVLQTTEDGVSVWARPENNNRREIVTGGPVKSLKSLVAELEKY